MSCEVLDAFRTHPMVDSGCFSDWLLPVLPAGPPLPVNTGSADVPGHCPGVGMCSGPGLFLSASPAPGDVLGGL